MTSNWEAVQLKDIVQFKTGKLDSNAAEDGGQYPFFTCSPITLQINTHAFDTEAVLLAGNNANGVFAVKYYKGKFNAYQRTYVITPLNESVVCVKWLYFRIKHVTSELQKMSVGTATKFLTKKILDAYEVQLPPIEEQERQAKILWDLQNKLDLNAKTNQTLEQMAQAIFKSWFVDFDPVKAKMNGKQPEGMDAATASLFPDKLVESELGLIPEGWPVDQVGNHIDLTKGKSYKSAELQESTTALVTLKSFKRGGGYRMDGLKEYTGKYKPQQVIEAGDLVMSLTDVTQAAEIVGKPALVIDAPQYDTLVASLDVAILRPKETNAKQYFYGLMSTYRFHRYAESFATGTTVLHLSPKGITTFEFACPSDELVEKYHKFAAPIFAKIEANILESQELAKLRDMLLPKLLSGEIDLGKTIPESIKGDV